MNYIKHKMRSSSPAAIFGWVVLAIIGITALIILFGFVFMWLWNWLMPEIFGLGVITFWQGVGLILIAKILFGGMGNSGSSSKKSKRKRRKEKCDQDDDNFNKWKHYAKYWEEEGDAAYKNYVNRMETNNTEEE
ncbi:MAG: hypothetical protein MK078_09935 [Crocinitomicaceae bacterium]|nr:hypothetical protein [Crocinitomicaceae bacterium]